jgi:hypothetical protein
VACDLIEPAHSRRLETRFRGIPGGIDHFDLDLHGILAATHPAFPFFPAFFHFSYSTG